MLYIFEGIDGAGKSYLIDKLCNDCKDIFVYKNKIENNKPWLDYRTAAYTNFMTSLEYYEQYFMKKDINVFIDRGYISEYVYGVNKRKYHTSEWVKYVEERIKNYAVLVAVTCSYESSKKRIEARGETFTDVDSDIIIDFEKCFNNNNLRYWMRFDSDENNKESYNTYYAMLKACINSHTFDKLSKEIK